MSTVRVVAAVIRREGRFLLGRRPDHKRHGGLWEFPGGKMREGEDYLAAARRELAEELSLDVTRVGDVLGTHADEGSPFVIHFVEVVATGTAVPLEHAEVAWLTPGDMEKQSLAPADERFLRAYVAEIGSREGPNDDPGQPSSSA